MKDITTQAIEQDSSNSNQSFGSYIVDDKAAETLYGAILMQSVKDLYNFSYDLAKELKKANRSGRKIGELKRNLEDLDEFFDSKLYRMHTETTKSVWYEWVRKNINKPRLNLDAMFRGVCWIAAADMTITAKEA